MAMDALNIDAATHDVKSRAVPLQHPDPATLRCDHANLPPFARRIGGYQPPYLRSVWGQFWAAAPADQGLAISELAGLTVRRRCERFPFLGSFFCKFLSQVWRWDFHAARAGFGAESTRSQAEH